MTLVHDSIIVRRRLKAPVGDVFRAWQDTRQLEAWCYPGNAEWTSHIEVHDFTTGGTKHAVFGPKGDSPYREESRYLDIRVNQHIINSERILAGDGRLISTSLVSVEFVATGEGCELVVSDQITLLDASDTPEQRRAGWNEVLDRLEPHLRR
jgi:uncharacterized protein YndB with AHSA1/START domain